MIRISKQQVELINSFHSVVYLVDKNLQTTSYWCMYSRLLILDPFPPTCIVIDEVFEIVTSVPFRELLCWPCCMLLCNQFPFLHLILHIPTIMPLSRNLAS